MPAFSLKKREVASKVIFLVFSMKSAQKHTIIGFVYFLFVGIKKIIVSLCTYLTQLLLTTL